MILAVIEDLFFRSKVDAAARAVAAEADVRVVRVGSLDGALDQAWMLIIVDLSIADPVAVLQRVRARLPQTPILSFFSHVQVELQRQAQAAGCTWVVPRSAFVQMLPDLLAGQLPSSA
jgi:DNA-binding NarL/FixJ family response regulator